MSEGATGFLVLIGISALTALLVHWLIRHYLLASVCAAVVASIGFQFAVYLGLGYLDPFFIIALVTGIIVAFAVAALVGLPFIGVRRKRKDDHVGLSMSRDKRRFSIGRLLLLFLLGLAVFAFALFVGLPSYELASASRSLDRALRGAQSVTITELVQYFDTSSRDPEPRYRVLSSIIPTPEQVEEFRRATNGVITMGSPLSHKRCFDPHHRVEIVRADGTFLRLEICFECDNFRFDDGAIKTMPRSWLQRLPTVFGKIGIPIRGREEYAKLNPNDA